MIISLTFLLADHVTLICGDSACLSPCSVICFPSILSRYYSTGIFQKVGVQAFVATAIVGIINFLTTFGTLVLVDKVRARPTLRCCVVWLLSLLTGRLQVGWWLLVSSRSGPKVMIACGWVDICTLNWTPSTAVTNPDHALGKHIRSKCLVVWHWAPWRTPVMEFGVSYANTRQLPRAWQRGENDCHWRYLGEMF